MAGEIERERGRQEGGIKDAGDSLNNNKEILNRHV